MGFDQNGPLKRRVTGKALFEIGIVVGTPGGTAVMRKHDIHPLILIARHASGDWGSVPLDDLMENERALKAGDRLMSVYKFGEDTLWVITEADRSATTILTPDEY